MSVEPAASGDSALVFGIDENYYFPYAVAKAPTNTNTGVPGKYVVDMNGKLQIK